MAKYARKFTSVSAATSDETLVSPNLTWVGEGDDEKLLGIDCGDDVAVQITGSSLSGLVIEEKPSAASHNVGDIAYCSNGEIKTVPYTGWTSSLGEALAVCVCPTSHATAWGDGKARFMSIYGVNADGTKATSNVSLKWGPTGTDTGLHNYDEVPCVGHDEGGAWVPDNTIDHTNSYAFLCGDNLDKVIQSPTDPTAYWVYNDGDCHIASPYMNDGSYNESYGATSYGSTPTAINNALSDFSGKANTTTLAALGTGYAAAYACKLYSTDGTSAGDWYLPACGELGYIIPRFTVINAAINACSGVALDAGYGYWSSSEIDSDRAYYVYTDDGSVGDDGYGKNGNLYVRPFFQLS